MSRTRGPPIPTSWPTPKAASPRTTGPGRSRWSGTGRWGRAATRASPPLGSTRVAGSRGPPLAIWLAHHVLFAGFPSKLWREHVARRLGPDAVALFQADAPVSSGSSGWLLAGERTATGAALLAGDPHRHIEDPGIYQQIRLACPAYDVVGLAVPGVPGTAHFGHTGEVAWAITNAMADYQDLYAERLRRRGSGVEAYGPDGWQPTRTHAETITVAGGEPVEVEVVETGRGPVVVGGPESAEAISLRYPPRVTGELGFAALPALLRARTVADVDGAVKHWVEPVNVVLAADTAGGLLHRVTGAVPARPAANGVRVVPAWEPRYAWSGWCATPAAALRDRLLRWDRRMAADSADAGAFAAVRAALVRRITAHPALAGVARRPTGVPGGLHALVGAGPSGGDGTGHVARSRRAPRAGRAGPGPGRAAGGRGQRPRPRRRPRGSPVGRPPPARALAGGAGHRGGGERGRGQSGAGFPGGGCRTGTRRGARLCTLHLQRARSNRSVPTRAGRPVHLGPRAPREQPLGGAFRRGWGARLGARRRPAGSLATRGAAAGGY